MLTSVTSPQALEGLVGAVNQTFWALQPGQGMDVTSVPNPVFPEGGHAPGRGRDGARAVPQVVGRPERPALPAVGQGEEGGCDCRARLGV